MKELSAPIVDPVQIIQDVHLSVGSVALILVLSSSTEELPFFFTLPSMFRQVGIAKMMKTAQLSERGFWGTRQIDRGYNIV